MNLLPEFEYKRPETLKETLDFLSHHGGKALLLAGGTDLVPRLKLGLKKPDFIVDIKELKEDLRSIIPEGNKVKIGALATIHALTESTLIRENFPALHKAAVSTASETIQRRGTIGGNILQDTRCSHYNKSENWRKAFKSCLKMGGESCNVIKGAKKCLSVYCGDLAPALLSLDASVVIMNFDGEREHLLENIFTGDGNRPFSLSESDFLKEIILPFSKTKGGFKKFRLRETIDYPVISVALSVDKRGKGNLVMGSNGPKPGKYKFSSPEELDRIPQRVYKGMKLINNMQMPPDYRKHLAKTFTERLIRDVMR